MILDCVLTATNEKSLYLDFIPIFIQTWNKLYPRVDIKIILIAKKIPDSMLCYESNIILFEPIDGVATSFTSQFIRLLYPCILDYKNGVIITDIDMLPMNRTYYSESIKSYENDKFIYYRQNTLFKSKQIAMCYNVATPRIWRDIFDIHSLDDIKSTIKYVSDSNNVRGGRGNIGWCLDQTTLYNKVMAWNEKSNNFICLKERDIGFKRLGRNIFDPSDSTIVNNISNGYYSDYHCRRPMSKHSDINYQIFNLL